jgi:hypothetical protein
VLLSSVGLPSIVVGGDRGEDRCCRLSIGWIGGDGLILSGDVHSYSRMY